MERGRSSSTGNSYRGRTSSEDSEDYAVGSSGSSDLQSRRASVSASGHFEKSPSLELLQVQVCHAEGAPHRLISPRRKRRQQRERRLGSTQDGDGMNVDGANNGNNESEPAKLRFWRVACQGRPSLLRLSVKGNPKALRLLFAKRKSVYRCSQWNALRALVHGQQEELLQALAEKEHRRSKGGSMDATGACAKNVSASAKKNVKDDATLTKATAVRLFRRPGKTSPSPLQLIFGEHRRCTLNDPSLAQLWLEPCWRELSVLEHLLSPPSRVRQEQQPEPIGVTLKLRDLLEDFVCGGSQNDGSLLEVFLNHEQRCSQSGDNATASLLRLVSRFQESCSTPQNAISPQPSILVMLLERRSGTPRLFRKVANILLHGERIDDETSLLRIATVDRPGQISLLRFLLLGEDQGKPSLLRLLLEQQEASEQQSPGSSNLSAQRSQQQVGHFLVASSWWKHSFLNKFDLPEQELTPLLAPLKTWLASFGSDGLFVLPILQATIQVLCQVLFELLFESQVVPEGETSTSAKNSPFSANTERSFAEAVEQVHIQQLKIALLGSTGHALEPIYNAAFVSDDNGLHAIPIIAVFGTMAGLRVRRLPETQHFDRLRWWQRELVKKLLLVQKTVHAGSWWCMYLSKVAAAIGQGGEWEDAFFQVADATANPTLAPRERAVKFMSGLFSERFGDLEAQVQRWESHWNRVITALEELPEDSPLLPLFKSLRVRRWDLAADAFLELGLFDALSFDTLFADLETTLEYLVSTLIDYAADLSEFSAATE